MDAKSNTNRFAHIDESGKLLSLVADGLPEWPADDNLAEISDADLGSMHEAYAAEAQAIADAIRSGEEADTSRIPELSARIPALRTEAASRMSQAQTDPALEELAALSDEDRAAVVEYAAAIAALENETDETDETDNAAALAALDALRPPEPVEVIVEYATIDPEAIAAGAARGTSEGITAALAPLFESVTAMTAGMTEALGAIRTPAVPARPAAATAADLARYQRPDQSDFRDAPANPAGHLQISSDMRGFSMGQEVSDMDQLVDAFVTRAQDIGFASGVEDESVVIANYRRGTDIPEGRDLRGLDSAELRRMVRETVGQDAIGVDPYNLQRELPISRGGIAVGDPNSMVASGGLAAPVEPFYGQLVLAAADRPFFGAMPGFVAERGGIKLTLPPTLANINGSGTPGLFTNGVTATDTGLVSATAAFTDADVGQPVLNNTEGGTGVIAAGTIIDSVTNATTVVLSAATTGTGTGKTFYLPSRNPNNLGVGVGVITAAQDAAGPPNTVKFTYDAVVGTQVEHDVYSVYTSLQFANLTARTFPEQVEANIRLANAVAARTAEQQAMDYVTGWSTLFTGAKTFGTARQLLAQFEHMAAYYRNHNRMDPAAVLRLGIPAWAINAMRGDYISSFIGGGDNWGLSDDELNSWFMDRHILPFFYWDGPSDISQLFVPPGSGAINTGGVNNATPVAIPDYPGQGVTTSFRTEVVSFMWAEGTWLGLTTGELNIGLVRDSRLNSQNRFRNFEEVWETPAFIGLESLRAVHTVAADGSYGAAASITLGAGSGL